MDNAERAEKAERIVSNYETDSSLEECLSDFLGDLRHLCDRWGIDFAERDGVGHRNYLADLAAERGADRRGSDREKLEAIAAASDGPNLQAILSHIGGNELERLGVENQLGDIPGEAQREAAALLA